MNNIVFGDGISGGNSESQSYMDSGIVRGRLAITFFVSFTGSCCDSWVDIQYKMHVSL